MARARNIKPGFFINIELGELPPIARLLFIGLWTVADREGRLKDQPKKIKIQTLPYDKCDVDKLLNQLHEAGFILRYQADGCRIIQILNFNKHQNPHIKEQASELPSPDIHGASTVQAPDKNGSCPADSLLLIPDTLNPITEAEQPGPDKNTKVKYADYVKMTKDQYDKLIDDHGKKATTKMIAILDNYKGAKGKTYKCDYRAILNWVVKRYEDEHPPGQSRSPTVTTALRQEGNTVFIEEVERE